MKTNEQEKLIKILENQWDMTKDNFFRLAAGGKIDMKKFEVIKNALIKLSNLVNHKEQTIDKRLVELTWYIPTYLRYQEIIWDEKKLDKRDLDFVINIVEERLTGILGLP